MHYLCPVCGFSGLNEPPYRNGHPSFETCPSCGFEFGFDDLSEGRSFDEYRREWLEDGARWFSAEAAPDGWSAERQLQILRGEVDG